MVKPRHVCLVLLSFLGMSWIIVWMIDLLNVGGIRDRIGAMAWANLFGNGGVVEWVQWYSLGAAALIAMLVAGRLFGRSDDDLRGLSYFWGGMAIALTLMLIEDAGNVRHEIRRLTEAFTGMPRHTGLVDRIVEFTYFVLLASVPLFTLIRFGKHLRAYRTTTVCVLGGFAFYALAASASATRNWGQWYAHAGLRLQEGLGFVIPPDWDSLAYGHYLMDALVEESVELIGATLFLAAAVSALSEVRRIEETNGRSRVPNSVVRSSQLSTEMGEAPSPGKPG